MGDHLMPIRLPTSMILAGFGRAMRAFEHRSGPRHQTKDPHFRPKQWPQNPLLNREIIPVYLRVYIPGPVFPWYGRLKILERLGLTRWLYTGLARTRVVFIPARRAGTMGRRGAESPHVTFQAMVVFVLVSGPSLFSLRLARSGD